MQKLWRSGITCREIKSYFRIVPVCSLCFIISACCHLFSPRKNESGRSFKFVEKPVLLDFSVMCWINCNSHWAVTQDTWWLLQASQISEKQEQQLRECRVGGKVMVLGKDESGMWRIAQLLFWSRGKAACLSPASSSYFLGMHLPDPCLGREGSLGVPSCLGVSECCRWLCKNLRTCLCQWLVSFTCLKAGWSGQGKVREGRSIKTITQKVKRAFSCLTGAVNSLLSAQL